MRHHTERTRLVLALVLVFATASMGLLVSAPPSRADHDTISWTSPIFVAGSTGFTDLYPQSVADSHGYVYVFYVTRNIGTSSSNLNVTKYDAVLGGLSPVRLFDKQVNSVANVVDGGLPFATTVDHSGNLFVAWARITSGGDQIWVSKSTDGGVTWLAAVQASGAGGSSYWPVITTTPGGSVYVAYDLLWGGSSYSVAVATSTDGGSSFGTPVNVTSPYYLWSPSITSDAAGRVYLAWGAITTSGNPFTISFSWSEQGTTWSAPATLSNSIRDSFFPALYADSRGTIHASWFSSESSDYAIRYSQSSDRGATWTGPIPIVTSGYGGGYIGYMAGEGDTVMYAYGTYANVVAFGVSGDHGGSWYPSSTAAIGAPTYFYLSADHNDTVWGVYATSNNIYMIRWLGPPSQPIVTGVAPSGSSSLTIEWTPSPEANVQEYRVYRSTDGSNYQIVGVVSGTATSFTDTGLANGTYFYQVDAVNIDGTASHLSATASGTVGPTTQDLINQLEGEIASLQSQLNSANTNLTSARAQLSSLQSQLTNLQNSQASSNAATAAAIAQLQANLTALQNQLNNLQSQQATQTISYANLAFEVIVVVLLVVLLLNQMRKPKAPQMMMAQPGRAEPSKPEDDL